MNIVLTLIQQHYDVPKGVMRYIIHMVRPRAPPRPEWECWSRGTKISVWYRWNISANYGLFSSVLDEYRLEITHYCNHCLKRIPSQSSLTNTCYECRAALKRIQPQI